jgi:hypothetical protein
MMPRVARTYVSTDVRILTNLAKTRGVREARTVPWSSLGPTEEDQPTVDPERFADANQRVLLHRARARMRTELEDYCRGVGSVVTS